MSLFLTVQCCFVVTSLTGALLIFCQCFGSSHVTADLIYRFLVADLLCENYYFSLLCDIFGNDTFPQNKWCSSGIKFWFSRCSNWPLWWGPYENTHAHTQITWHQTQFSRYTACVLSFFLLILSSQTLLIIQAHIKHGMSHLIEDVSATINYLHEKK